MPQLLAPRARLRRGLKVAARPLPPQLRYAGAQLLNFRSRGVRERAILGRYLQIEGTSHGQADQDDAWVIALLSHSRAFLDVGCNVGYFALAGCVANPELRVLAIDANPRCAAATAGNLVRNGYGDRTRTVASFVSDSAGEVVLHTVGLAAAGSAVTGFAHTAEGMGRSVTVASNTLDAIVERAGFEPDFVKIDVEGAECQVLAGAVHTVDRCRPRLLVEMHSGDGLTMFDNTTEVLRWCTERDYAAWYLATNERLEDAQPVAHRGRCHLLLQPTSEPFPSVLTGIEQGAPVAKALERVE